MPPHKDGSYIVARYVEHFGDVLDGKTYILLTKEQGIVYKRLNKNGKNALMAQSDNNFYPTYQVKASEILEIWEYASSISTEEFKPDAFDVENLNDVVRELRRDIMEIKTRFH